MSSSTDDLRTLIESGGPCLTLLLPAPSHHADAAERFAIECKNALKQISGHWPDAELVALEHELAALPHDAGAGVIVVHCAGGTSHIEFVDDPVSATVFEGPLPHLAPLLESRQRTIAHVVVEADRAGATMTAFDGGEVLANEIVEGDTEHIHRGHFSGWSQRRYQQRAENTWDDNADDVAAAAHALAQRVHARLVVVAGPPRARSMVVESLGNLVRNDEYTVHPIDAGDVDGVAGEVTRLTADIAAADAVAAIHRAQESTATAVGFDGDVLAALAAGRVETLLVNDNTDPASDDGHVDQCIARALATGADIVVVPNVAILDRGVAAILRW